VCRDSKPDEYGHVTWKHRCYWCQHLKEFQDPHQFPLRRFRVLHLRRQDGKWT
jgi:hypothetical protein